MKGNLISVAAAIIPIFFSYAQPIINTSGFITNWENRHVYLEKGFLNGNNEVLLVGSLDDNISSYTDIVPSSPSLFLEPSSTTQRTYIVRYTSTNNANFAKTGCIGCYFNAAGTDSEGNIYYAGTGRWNGNPSDILIGKYNSNGTELFRKIIGGSGVDYTSALAVNANGTIYIIGKSTGNSVDLDPGPGVKILGDVPAFLASYDSNGNFLNAISIPRVGFNDRIVIDNSGNIILACDTYIAKYTSQLNLIWSNVLSFGINGIAVSNIGEIAINGTFTGTLDVDPGIGVYNLSSAGGSDILVGRFDQNGNFQSAFNIGGPDNESARSIAFDLLGNIYVGGDYRLNTDFDPGAGTVQLGNVSYSYGYGPFISKYTVSGKLYWAYNPEVAYDVNYSRVENEDVYIDTHGNLIWSCTYHGFYPGNATVHLFTYSQPVTVTSLSIPQGLVGTTVTITGKNFDFNPANNIVKFNGVVANVTSSTPTSITTTVPVGATTGSITVTVGELTGTSSSNFTINKINQTITFPSLPGNICGNGSFSLAATASSSLPVSYTSSNPSVATIAGTTLTVSGVGTTTITASQSGNSNFLAASSVSQVLTANPIPPTPGIVGPSSSLLCGSTTLTSSAASSYLWSNGATTQTITATAGGNYTVTTGANGCTATSAPFTLNDGRPKLRIIAGSTDFCGGATATFRGPYGSSFLWSNGATTQDITVSHSGSYSVTVTNPYYESYLTAAENSGGRTQVAMPLTCSGTYTSAMVIIAPKSCEGSSLMAATEEEEKQEYTLVYPNPSHEEAYVVIPQPTEVREPIKLFDMQGKVVFESYFEKGEYNKAIYTKDIAEGMYLVRIGKNTNRKLIIVH